jgi:hypothetical protein
MITFEAHSELFQRLRYIGFSTVFFAGVVHQLEFIFSKWRDYVIQATGFFFTNGDFPLYF